MGIIGVILGVNKKQGFNPKTREVFKNVIEMNKKYKLILIKTLYWISVITVGFIASWFIMLYLIAYYVDID